MEEALLFNISKTMVDCDPSGTLGKSISLYMRISDPKM